MVQRIEMFFAASGEMITFEAPKPKFWPLFVKNWPMDATGIFVPYALSIVLMYWLANSV